MAGYYSFISGQSRFGLLLLRLMTGIVFTYHGYQKFFVIGIGGSELELMLLFSSFLLATHGSGVYALHARLRLPGE